MVGQKMEGEVRIYAHDEVREMLKSMMGMLLGEPIAGLLGTSINLVELKDKKSLTGNRTRARPLRHTFNQGKAVRLPIRASPMTGGSHAAATNRYPKRYVGRHTEASGSCTKPSFRRER